MFAAELIPYFIRQHSNIKNENIVLSEVGPIVVIDTQLFEVRGEIYHNSNFDSEITVFIILIDHLFCLSSNNFNNFNAEPGEHPESADEEFDPSDY